MTEFEENVSFDIDDPDFAPSNFRAIPNSNAYRTVQLSDITFGVNKCEYIYFSGMGIITGTVTSTNCANGLIAFLNWSIQYSTNKNKYYTQSISQYVLCH